MVWGDFLTITPDESRGGDGIVRLVSGEEQIVRYSHKFFVLNFLSINTDKLSSYGAAKKELLPRVEQRQHKRLNNGAENSHQPTRVREKVMRRFKSQGQAQRFLSAHGPIREHFRPKRHKLSAVEYRTQMQERFGTWNEVSRLSKIA